ncbi:MAG: hypothetical protein ACYSWO_29520 [Planctomycetota bacterium]|jgi:hypothetical protein
MKVSVHWMLIGKSGRVAYDRFQYVEVSNDNKVITLKFPEPMVVQQDDQLIAEIIQSDPS